jgi:hypothetical protein
METIQWQGKTYKLPAKLTEGIDDRYECERYLENTLRGKNSNELAPFSQRLTLLDDRFNFPQLMNEVNGILVNLHDFTQPTGDGPIILSTSSKVFMMTEPGLFNDSRKQLRMPPCNEAVSAAIRESAWYYSFK